MPANLFRVETGFDIDEKVHILYGTDNPTGGIGVSAPKGSLYLRNPESAEDGEVWFKYGDADTEWKNSDNTNINNGLVKWYIDQDLTIPYGHSYIVDQLFHEDGSTIDQEDGGHIVIL